jgi:hypothetical protein
MHSNDIFLIIVKRIMHPMKRFQRKMSTKDQELSRFESHPRLTLFLVFLALYLIIDLMGGIFFIPSQYQHFRVKHSYYHHGIMPHADQITTWGQIYYPFRSNSMGFRDIECREVALQSPVRRILFMGDSHTEGVGVLQEKTFVGRLAQALDTMDIEVLNGSAVSYSPKIHYLKCKYLIEEARLHFDELYVIIDMSDLNNEIAYQYFEPVFPRPWSGLFRSVWKTLTGVSLTSYHISGVTRKLQNRYFYRNVRHEGEMDMSLYATFFRDFKDGDLLNDPDFHNVSRWIYDEEYRELAKKSLDLGQENLRLLARLCKQHGIRLTITVHPWQEQIMREEKENYYVESWKNFAASEGIGFVNLFSCFVNGENPVIVANRYYISNDSHWNEHGHDLVFRELLPRILHGR